MGIHLTKSDMARDIVPKIVADDFIQAMLKAGARHGRRDLALVQGAHDAIAKLVDCIHCGGQDVQKDVEKYNENHDDSGRFASGGGSGADGAGRSAEEAGGPTMAESLDEDAAYEEMATNSYGPSVNHDRKKVGKRGARHSKIDLEKIQQAHDTMVGLGAKCGS